VTVKADARTGLTRPDVFYFGNLVGETGAGGDLRVTTADVLAVRRAIGSAATTDSRLAFDRSGTVTWTDLVAARDNLGRVVPALSPADSAVAPLDSERAHALLA